MPNGPGIAAALEYVVAQLEGIELRADLDPAKVNTPAAWVTPGAAGASPITLDDTWAVHVDVVLIAASTTPAAAFRQLDEMAAKVAGILPLEEPIEPMSASLPGSSTPLPAYRYPVLIHTP